VSTTLTMRSPPCAGKRRLLGAESEGGVVGELRLPYIGATDLRHYRLGGAQPQRILAKWALWAFLWVEIQFTQIEEDGSSEAREPAKASCCCFDLLDLRVHALCDSVGNAVFDVR